MEDELIAFGGELKALGEGKIGGVLVRMTDKNQPDLTGDFFDAKGSDVRFPESLDVYYNHGMDSTLKKRVIGQAKLSKMENGDVWAETQLKMRDEYEKAIYAMAEAGKLGYSSGALSHLVDREPAGKGVWMIKTWVIGEASLTPTPAEYRNTVVTLKSLTPPDAALPDKDDEVQPIKTEKKTMDELDVKTLVAQELEKEAKAREAKEAAEAARQAELKAASDAAYKQALEDVKSNPTKTYHSSEKFDDDNDGIQAFKSWMATGQENGGLIKPDSSYEKIGNAKAAWNVTTAASGGNLVPDPLYQQIQAKRNIASWVRQLPVQHFQTSADHLIVPVEGTSLTAFTKTLEAAAYTEEEAEVDQVDLVLYKYTKLTKVSEEFLMYQGTNWESWFANTLGRAEAVTENTIFTSGTGSSQPLGIIGSANASTVANTLATADTVLPAELTAFVGYLGGGYNVPSECGFLMANKTKWYLRGVTSSAGAFVYTPTPDGNIGGDQLLGYKVVIDDDLAPYTTNAAKIVVFGNWNYYGVVEKPGMIVQRNPYLYMANGQVGIFASIFRGGQTLQKEAFYYLTNQT